MSKHFSKIIFLIISCISFNCFAAGSTHFDNGCCIEEVIDNKVYLKPTTIQIARNGIFINVGGELHAINHLDSDVRGVFFDLSKAKNGDDNIIVKNCPLCGDSMVFGYCLNANCKGKQRD